jgi:(1->4)-alpha-D-glucan 1-alpha-D-glucosylmutase
VQGTTGYEFANDVTALFVDPAGKEPLTELYAELTGEQRPFAEVAHEAKLEVARTTFAQEFERLRTLYPHDGLEEAAAALHVYRTYVESERVDDEDRKACAVLPEDLRRVILGFEHPEFVVRWQQTTGPVMAKGVEDTAFYRWFRLTALNEVGGNPDRFSLSPDDFHRGAYERLERHPHTLLASQTHDTKRAGDVRARIGALAGFHDEWAERVLRWHALTGGMDDPNEEYLVWQTLVGAWPIVPGRLERYLEKALREAKRNTNWVEQNHDWEAAVKRFGRALYDERTFLDDFEPFVGRVAQIGDRAALGQLVLKLTAPGIPDIYQGDELPFRALVDPDNRRPVDFDWRQAMLRRLMGGTPPVAQIRKMFVTLRLLGLRGRRPAPFAGDYDPVEAGPAACSFVRGGDVLVVVGVRGTPDYEGTLTELPDGRWRDVLRGEERSWGSREAVADVVGEHGVGVFERL